MTDDKDFDTKGPSFGSTFDFQTAAASSPDEAQTVTMAPLSSVAQAPAAASAPFGTVINATPAAPVAGSADATMAMPAVGGPGAPANPLAGVAGAGDSGSGDIFGGAATVTHRRKKPVALIVLLSLLALVIVLFAGYVIGGQYYFKDKAAPGVRFGTVSVAGQNADQLRNTVNDAVKSSTVKVTVPDGRSTTATLADLGVSVDVDRTVNDLLAASKQNFVSTVNPFAKDSVPLRTSTDKMAMSTYLSDKLIGEDARVVNATTTYDAESGAFTATKSRAGESPDISGVVKAVAAVQTDPGSARSVSIATNTVAAPISDQTAANAAAEANKRLDSKLVITNGDKKKTVVPADQVAQWIKPVADPTNGTITLTYDENAVNAYLSSELPKQLNQTMVPEENVVNSQGKVITTTVKGVNGIEVTDTANTAKQVVAALQNGTVADNPVKADVKVVQHETKSRQVNYDIPDGDPHMVINLSEQKAYAYKGTTLVRTFLVSTGKPSTPTDTGTFFASVKYQSQTMRGEDYVTPNVPWVTYYNGSEGFHGAPWNPGGIASGTPKSHGCTNMSVDEAKWVYDFLPIGGMVQVVGSTPTGAVR